VDKENMIYTYTHTMEYYSAIKNNENILFAGKWMKLEIIMLSEISQAQKSQISLIRCQWLTLVILVTWEAEIKKIEVQSQPRQKSS
jgi:hypothetical protein